MSKSSKNSGLEEEAHLHITLPRKLKALLKRDADARGLSMSGLLSNIVFDRYNNEYNYTPQK